MRISDLVTPWTQLAASGDAADREAFRRRHSGELEPLRRQRAPTESAFPLHDTPSLGDVDPADLTLHATLRSLGERMAGDGFRLPAAVVLVASPTRGGALEVIPEPGQSLVALALPCELPAMLAAGIAMLHRATDPASGTGLSRAAARGMWDKWRWARELPLAEWIYAAGIGVHAAREYVGVDTATAVGVSTGAFSRLRTTERALQERLDADLDDAGTGLMLRWLEDDAPLAMRRAPDGFVVPAGAGRYLGWRMLEERVARVGLLEASTMGA
jgi:hypothetical protein